VRLQVHEQYGATIAVQKPGAAEHRRAIPANWMQQQYRAGARQASGKPPTHLLPSAPGDGDAHVLGSEVRRRPADEIPRGAPEEPAGGEESAKQHGKAARGEPCKAPA
jgi:hypothetical protein